MAAFPLLELRFPVLPEDFHIRTGSGGRADGAPAWRAPHHPLPGTVEMLSSHRALAPRFPEGGGMVARGATSMVRSIS